MAKLYYVLSDYFATGEGITQSLVVTPALPRADDYIKQDDYSDIRTVNTPEERAIRECEEEFGYFGLGAELVEYEKIERLLPEYLKKIISDGEGMIHYKAQFHFNLS